MLSEVTSQRVAKELDEIRGLLPGTLDRITADKIKTSTQVTQGVKKFIGLFVKCPEQYRFSSRTRVKIILKGTYA